MITVRCLCGECYDVDEAMAGGESRCPVCNRKMIVPEGRSAASAGQSGLATAKYVQQTNEPELTPEQVRRLAKHRGKQHRRGDALLGAPMMGGIGIGMVITLILLFRALRWRGILLWLIGGSIIAAFAGFLQPPESPPTAEDQLLTERELEQQSQEQEVVANDEEKA